MENQRRSFPRLLVVSYAILYGVMGLVALFLPELALGLLGWPAGAEIVMNMVAPGLLAVAVMNWTGRNAIYGGIYGRPILLANLMVAATAGYPLIEDQWRRGHPIGVALGVLILLQFPGVWQVMRRSPV